MKVFMKNFVALLLSIVMCCSCFTGVLATTDNTKIISTDMSFEKAENNLENFYSTNEEMTEKYPDGLFVVEYKSYGIYEGGSDTKNPQDVYLGINVYRLGGNSSSAEVTFMVSPVVADKEVYFEQQGTVEFDPQQLYSTAKVKIYNDDIRKGDQVLMFALVDTSTGELSEGSSAIITITDDEPHVESEISISVDKATIDKSEGNVTVTLSRNNTSVEYCTFKFKTGDGTAKADVDYTATEENLVFGPGQTKETVQIPLIQSDNVYKEPKYFMAEIYDFAACKADGESKIRINITNKDIKKAKKITEVSGEADLKLDDDSAITDSVTPVVNVNDTVDRAELLRSVIGAANGTSVQAVPPVDFKSSLTKWESEYTLSPSDFQEVFNHSDTKWEAGSEFDDGNENVMLTSKNPIDLNRFKSITYKYSNDEWGINGNPNTACGYLDNPEKYSSIDTPEDKETYNKFFFVTYEMSNCTDSEYTKLCNNKVYFLINENNANVDFMDKGKTKSLVRDSGYRYSGASGLDGSDQYLFYMLYDDEGWDDHHFNMGDTILHRDVIPFSAFNSDDIVKGSLKVINNATAVTFQRDGFNWTLTVDDTSQGGTYIADDTKKSDEDKYGFFTGSLINVKLEPIYSTADSISPTSIKLVDSDGIVHDIAETGKNNSFTVKLETLMNNNVTELQKSYGYTYDEAKAHAGTVNKSTGTINSSFEKKLSFAVEYESNQGVSIDFLNCPTLYEDQISANGYHELDDSHINRVISALNGSVKFYDDKGSDITPDVESVNLNSGTLNYPVVDFSYLIVDPTVIGGNYVMQSNLYDLDYQRIEKATKITYEICQQTDGNAIFSVIDANATYLKPKPTITSTEVSVLDANTKQFTNTYNADSLDTYIPFECFYGDTEAFPAPSYYTVSLNISSIYANGMTSSEKKEFVVDVYRSSTDGKENDLLFNFTFVGGQVVSNEMDVTLSNLSEKFTPKMESDNVTDPYKPVVKLKSYSEAGYKYVLYIPSVYNYQMEAQDQSDSRYNPIFLGDDGISIDIHDYDKGDNQTTGVISSIDVNDTIYIAKKLPNAITNSEDEYYESPYFEEQNDFPTYQDNNTLIGLSGFTVDTNNLGLFLSNIFESKGKETSKKVAGILAGSGVYAKVNNTQIIVGAKICLNVGKTVEANPYVDDYDVPNEAKPFFELDDEEGPVPINGASEVGASNKRRRKEYTEGVNEGKIKLGGNCTLDANVQLDYSTIYHEFKFSKVNYSLSFIGSVVANIPIPQSGGCVYVIVTTSAGVSLATSYAQVFDYVDTNGKVHYTSYHEGLTLKPTVSIAGGLGLGVSGVFAVEGTVATDIAFTFAFGNVDFKPSQNEFDIASNTELKAKLEKNYSGLNTSYTFNGDWKTEVLETDLSGGTIETFGQDYYYGNTKCISDTIGDTLNINTEGSSFHLTGVRNSDGGQIQITVTDTTTGDVLDVAKVNTYSEEEQRYQTIYYWQMENYSSTTAKNISVQIENISDANGETQIILDSFRVYNKAWHKNERIDAQFLNHVFKIGMAVKFVLGPFDIVIEPAYMQVVCTEKKQTITIGSFSYSSTYDVTVKTASQDEDIPVVMATARGADKVSQIDYFDTGNYSETKTLTTVANNVDHSTKTQVICHTYNNNGKLTSGDYSFYSLLTRNSVTGETDYSLYYAIDGVEQGKVSEEVLVSDFFAFEDEKGLLNVAYIATDSTITSITGKEGEKIVVNFSDGTSTEIEDTSQISEIIQANCVKLAVFDENNNVTVKSIGNTGGDGYQDSRPVVASTPSGNTVLFYVTDEPTDVKADVDLNYEGFSEASALSSQSVEDLLNALNSGRAQISCAIKNDGGEFSTPVSLDLLSKLGEEKFKTGFKITSMDAVMADENTVCLAFSGESPYVRTDKEQITGMLKEIYYCTGKISQGKITFGDIIVVDTVIDYDKKLDELFSDVTQLSSKYYNSKTGETYDSNILTDVQIENVKICENKTSLDDVTLSPTLFYMTNSSINYANYDSLSNPNGENSAVKVLFDEYFDDYVIAPDSEGNITLIYSDPSLSGAYMDTLNLIEYDAEAKMWNSPRQLTYSDVFDQVAYDNKSETSSLIFDNLSAFVNDNGKVAVALRSSCIPFTYDKGVTEDMLSSDYTVDMSQADALYVNEDGTTEPMITVPSLDYESDKARSDIALLTFENPVTDMEVTYFSLDNLVFSKDSEIEADIAVTNTGDKMINGFKASLYYYDLGTGTKSSNLVTQTLTNPLAAGESAKVYLYYEVDEIPDNMLLCVKLTDSSGRVTYYDSYKDNYLTGAKTPTYHKIDKSAEILINGTNVSVDNKGIMNFDARISNIGVLDAESDVKVYCNAYDDKVENNRVATLFSFTVDSQYLISGGSYIYSGDYDVSDIMYDDVLYYNFEISTDDKQYDTENDVLDVAMVDKDLNVETESMVIKSSGNVVNTVSKDGHRIFDIKLGDELEIDTSVVSGVFKDEDICAFEIGTNCLSIDNSDPNGVIKIKVVALPEGGEGYVKLLLNIKGTVIYKYFYLNINNSELVNFDETYGKKDWTVSGKDYIYASEFDTISTDVDGSKMDFKFCGKNLKLYGDYLINGGSFEVVVKDSDGNIVDQKIVDTKKSLNNVGMLLYSWDNDKFGDYDVSVKALLEQGEKLVLDCAKYTVDTTGADTTPYAQVNSYTENLDAPLVDGRQRQANFTLNFNKQIKISDDKKLEDLKLDFNEYEKAENGEYVATGNTVTFIASKIEDKALVFNGAVSSKPGVVRKYVLAQSVIPSDFITDIYGNEVEGAIPDYDTVTYEIKESGIVSVTVADDTSMPDGSVQKSVYVKFAEIPDISRLEGTKLIYTTTDDKGKESEIEFKFAQMTNDPTTAVYRGDELTLGNEEISKTFTFEKGIVLNEDNFVLITSQGDYLENDISTVITDTSQLNITYNKLKVTDTNIQVVENDNGFVPTVNVTFDGEIDVQKALNNAYVTVTEIVEGNENDIILKAKKLIDKNTVSFEADKAITLSHNSEVEYRLKSSSVEYVDNGFIKNANDGIAVAHKLTLAEPLKFNTSCYAVSSKPYFEKGNYSPSDNTLCVDVTFSALIDETSLKDTKLNVKEHITQYEGDIAKTLTLSFNSAKTVTVDNTKCTVATYKYVSSEDDITLARNETGKDFVSYSYITVNNNNPIITVSGDEVSTSILKRDDLSFERIAADDAQLKLINNSQDGYNLELILDFDDDVLYNSEINPVYAFVDMTEGNGDETILGLKLISADNNTLVFVTNKSFNIPGNSVTTFKLQDLFYDNYENVVDKNNVGVSEKISHKAELVVDNVGKGVVSKVKTKLENGTGDKVKAISQVVFNENISVTSFENSQINAIQRIIYPNGQVSQVAVTLTFKEVNGGNTAIYEAELDVPDGAVSVELTALESIKTLTDKPLLSKSGGLALSSELCKTEKAKAERLRAVTTAIIPSLNDTIEGTKDIVLGVTFDGSISVKNIEDITIVADVSGVENINKLTFKGYKVYNGNSIVFVTDNNITSGIEDTVTVSVTDGIITVPEGSYVRGANGLDVLLSVPDCSYSLKYANPESTQSPTENTKATKPTETTKPAVKPTQATTDPAETNVTTSGVVSTTSSTTASASRGTILNNTVSAQIENGEAVTDSTETTEATTITVASETEKETESIASSQSDDKEDEKGILSPWLLLLIIPLVLIFAGVVIFIILLRKKKKQEEEN